VAYGHCVDALSSLPRINIGRSYKLVDCLKTKPLSDPVNEISQVQGLNCQEQAPRHRHPIDASTSQKGNAIYKGSRHVTRKYDFSFLKVALKEAETQPLHNKCLVADLKRLVCVTRS
jgi:hypothetical protein